jgi:predicted 3-demethylubiquinone-9 3-methyltransferase (glyoxalase superfamily)
MPATKPCLWFPNEAEEAANYYVSIFPNSKILNVMRGGGTVIGVDFVLDGSPFMTLNGRKERGFTDATSFSISCEGQQEVDRYWDALVEGGAPGRCGWLTDRYGVSWQVVPNELGSLLGGTDPAKAGRAMQAMLAMSKLDVNVLRRARDGETAAQPA